MTVPRYYSGAVPVRPTVELLRFDHLDERARDLGLQMWARKRFTMFGFAPMHSIRDSVEFMDFDSASAFLTSLS